MPMLVVSDWLPNGSRQIADAAKQAGWQLNCLEGRPVPSSLQDRDPVYYGAVDVAHAVARQLGIALLEPPLDWLARLPSKYKVRPVHLATVGEARRLASPAFVKPAEATNKCFDSGVYPGGWAIPERRGFADSTPVLISEPVIWAVEYRCFLLEDEVTAFTPYARAGRWIRSRDGKWEVPPPEAEQVLRLCRALVADEDVALPPAVVVDIGHIEGRGWAVVEANPAWGSGLYGCDAASVLPVLRRASVQLEELTEEDRRWVLESRQ